MKTKARQPEPQRLANAYPWLPPSPEAATVSERDGMQIIPAVLAPVPRVCLSRSDAARALGIGLSTLKALEREGIAPPAFDAPGGRKLYPVASLVQWANHRAQGGFQGLHDGRGRATDVVDGCLTADKSGV